MVHKLYQAINRIRPLHIKATFHEFICENLFNTLLYLKFLVLWVLVILADFILEFRFEFLWPFYLLLRSVYDSFKYQGLAFSIFFVCIALTSDMLCFFFIPVHWLFFAASTYVWVQYVWHTDKGICTPTIILWVLFVYLEAAVRLRDVKHMPGHLDLCRPFAAHCIGYPVVTLGFGFKSYIGYRIRQRKQRDVAKENEFYMQLMQQALPLDATSAASNSGHHQPEPATNSAIVPVQNSVVTNSSNTTAVQNNTINHKKQQQQIHHERNGHIPNATSTTTQAVANGGLHSTNINTKSHRKSVDKCKDQQQHSDEQQHQQSSQNYNNNNNNKSNDNKHHQTINDKHKIHNHLHTNGTAVGAGVDDMQISSSTSSLSSSSSTVTSNVIETENRPPPSTRRREKREQDKEREATEYLQKLELDNKRMRIELQQSRTSEQELRLQVAALTTSEKVSKGEISTMQREIEDLQQRLQNATSARNSDKQTISNLERRIAEERRNRCNLEQQLNQERKNRKQEEARAAQVVAAAQSAAASSAARGECTEACKARRRELENELNELRTAKHWAEERYTVLERENGALHEQLRDTDILVSALNAMQEKNAHLENSLSAETRIKLDLFSALGEAKRQLEIRESSNRTQEREIEELKSKIAQVLAIMPNDTFGAPTPGATSATMSRVRLAESPPGSTLDPNATAYTPKSSLVASTEA